MEVERKKRAQINAANAIEVSKDSINNHIGNVGRFIARHIEHREAEPEKR